MRKGLAAFLAILFFLLFPIGLITITAQVTLLDPAFYKAELAKNDIYGKSYPLMLGVSGDTKEFSRAIPLSSAEMEQVLRQAVPRDFIVGQTEAAIDQFFFWLNSPESTPGIVISLAEIKTRLPGAITNALESKLSKLPACPPGGIPRTDVFPECLPQGVSVDALKNVVHPGAVLAGEELARTLPDKVNLLDTVGKSGAEGRNAQSGLASLKRAVGGLKLAALISVVALIVMLLLIVALIREPTARVLRWTGATLLASGLASLMVFLLFRFVGITLFESGIEAAVRMPMSAWSTIVTTIVISSMKDFLMLLNVESGVAACLGLLLLFSARNSK